MNTLRMATFFLQNYLQCGSPLSHYVRIIIVHLLFIVKITFKNFGRQFFEDEMVKFIDLEIVRIPKLVIPPRKGVELHLGNRICNGV
jgi:hypothetical protein